MNNMNLNDIVQAYYSINKFVYTTPIITSKLINEICDTNIFLKCDNFQKSGSFKIRGVYHKLKKISKEKKVNGVVAYSSGNHGQALALSSSIFKMKCTIVMPTTVPESKVAAARSYGAHCLIYGNVKEAYEKAIQIGKEQNMLFVPAFEDPVIMAGHGTASLEILNQVHDINSVVIGIGGGGLISGMAVALKNINPKIHVIGVEPTNSATMLKSITSGNLQYIPDVKTIADGLAAPNPGKLAYSIVKKYVDEIITVDDSEIIYAIKLLLTRCKILSEPSGAAPLAVLLSKKNFFKKESNVVLFVSGGNIDLSTLKKIL